MTNALLGERRDLNRGFGDALSTAVELALTPAIFAFLGWRLDRWLGTEPLLLVSFFVLVVVYLFWKQFSRYGARMREEQSKMFGPRGPER